jgi:N-acetylglucosaminyldiphosphoundecaprenol N-acetyl-beta-D-mannosaminyltransferase
MDHEGILQKIEAAKPDLLLVAFGNPKQELFLAMHRERLKVPVAIGVGGSFELIGGFLKRAPNWMQTTGLEWVYRILREPRRLMGRYVRDGFVLITTLPRQLIAICLRRRSHAGMAIEVEQHGGSAVVYMSGELSGSMLPVVIDEVDALLRTHTPVVMDASRVEFLDGDGVGMLMRLQHLAMKYHTPYWVAGMSRRAMGILDASRSQRNLPLADSVAQALRRIRVGMGMCGELDAEHCEKFAGEPVGNTVVR